MSAEGANLYRYFLRKIKELEDILDTEKLPPSEQQEIIRTKEYMAKMAARYQPMYRDYVQSAQD